MSAVRSVGKTQWVYLTAPVTEGGDYAFAVLDDASWVHATPNALPSTALVKKGESDGVWVVSLGANESVAMWPAEQVRLAFAVAPLEGNRSEWNYWGYNHNMQPLH